MVIQHHFIIHLIDVIAGQDQYILRMKRLHIVQILVDRIRSTRIPLAVIAFLVRRKNRDSSEITVQIPRNTNPDMRIQPQRLVLGQYPDSIDSRVDTVTERKVYNPIFASKSNCRLGHFCSKDA